MKKKQKNKRIKKTIEGIVISNKMNKTVVVRIERFSRHPIYGKIIKKRGKAYAHDEENKCKIGDKVLLIQTRPLSKLKRWRVLRVLS